MEEGISHGATVAAVITPHTSSNRALQVLFTKLNLTVFIPLAPFLFYAAVEVVSTKSDGGALWLHGDP